MTRRAWSVAVAFAAGAGTAMAEEDRAARAQLAEVTDVGELSLTDLLDTEIDIASRTPQTTRETPGIVTVITRDDILTAGARELLDVLVLVPGFTPGVDVQGVVDLGVRGQWGHEGKILLYSSIQLGNHYPIEIIDRIEVMRGPGSAVYGGWAELAVINIITRDATRLDGVAVATSYGQLGRTVGHASAQLSFGATDAGVEGLDVAASFALGHGGATGTYRDFAGASYDMSDHASTTPMFGKLALDYHGLRADLIVDRYSLRSRDSFGPVDDVTSHIGFHSYALGVRYAFALDDHVTLTPRIGVLHQLPWSVDDPASEVFYQKSVTRYSAGAAIAYDPTPRLNLLAGAELLADRAHVDDPGPGNFLFAGKRDVSYNTIATYAQLLANHAIANLTVGARYEHQSSVGSSLVPRIALTKVVGRFHAKLLASQAFRAPGIENINLSRGLQPERTTVFEAEAGYMVGDHLFVAANAFDVTIKRPIVYDFDEVSMTENYQNFARSGTRGVELDARFQVPRGAAKVTYSYYSAAGKNEVDAYAVPDRDDALLAFPTHKVTLAGNVRLQRNLTLSSTAVIYGPRWGYTRGDADGAPVLGRHATTAQVNAYLLSRDWPVRGLELGAGVYNLADQRFDYLQPYDGGHAPLPGTGRELVFRVAYERAL